MKNIKEIFSLFFERLFTKKTIVFLVFDLGVIIMLWCGWVVHLSHQPHEYCGSVLSGILTTRTPVKNGQPVTTYYALIKFDNGTSTKMQLDKPYTQKSKLCFTQSAPPVPDSRLKLAHRTLFTLTILFVIWLSIRAFNS